MIPKKTKLFYFIFIILNFNLLNLYSQININQFNFKKINSDDGLSNGIVYGIFQDKKGFMWFTTQDGGLNRFDGYNIKVFKHNPFDKNSIASNNLNFICEDDSGYLWISTWGNGLAKYDPSKEIFEVFKSGDKSNISLSSNKIQFIKPIKNEIWLGTADAGLNCFDIKTKKIKIYKYDPKNTNSISNNRIWGFVVDNKNNFWIATSNGLNYFDRGTETFKHFTNEVENKNSLSDNTIRSITIDSKGNLWLGTNKGVDMYDPITSKFTHYQLYENNSDNIIRNIVNTILIDNEGIVWVGTQEGGLNRIDPKTNLIQHYINSKNGGNSISYDDVRTIYQDKLGLIWIGTRGGGINYFEPNGINFNALSRFSDPQIAIGGKHVNCMVADKEGRIWIGTDFGGIDVYDPSNKKTIHFNNKSKFGRLSGNFILSIAIDADECIWISYYEGYIDVLNPKTGTIKTFNEENSKNIGFEKSVTNILCRDFKGNMWLGTSQGLYCYDRISRKFTKFKQDKNNPNSLSENRVSSIICDENQNIWIGTDNGLNIYNYQSQEFKHFFYSNDNPQTLNSSRIYSIFQDTKKNIWVGTEFGLNKFEPKSKIFTRILLKDSTTNLSILSINDDEYNNLWLGTAEGLCLYNYSKKITKRFYVTDGLLNNEFRQGSTVKNKYGYLFFGNSEGLSFFKSNLIKEKIYEPQLSFTDFILFDKSIKPIKDGVLTKTISHTDTIILTHKDLVFSFEFTLFEFINPSINKYAFKMDGFDKNWIISNRRFATYTALPAGEYSFKVQAFNSNGILTNKEIRLTIIVKPPYWKTWWFYILTIIASVLTLISIINIRTKIIQNEKIKLEILVDERTQEIVKAKDEIEAQRDRSIKQSTEITASIQYARRIQGAILPPDEYLRELFDDYFIFFKPKDIVSGDFYLVEQVSDIIILAVADCTGHGVPGAFMSLLGISFITEIISKLHHDLEIKKIDEITASYILDSLKTKLVKSLHQTGKFGNSKDGMDISMIVIDVKNKKIHFAGANNSIYIARNQELIQLQADKMPIGYRPNTESLFTDQIFEIQSQDIIYLFTDGYLDQFGGPKGRKFLTKNFISLLNQIKHLDLKEQNSIIESTYVEWKNDNKQVDDVLIMGLKIF